MDDAALLAALGEAAAAVGEALATLDDWGLAGTRPGQYRSDLAADEAAVRVLRAAGCGVLSEESGLTDADAEFVVILDPVDGSTNASRRIPWFATSLCAVDSTGEPRAALVVNQATGDRYEAQRGGGARKNGRRIAPSACAQLADAVVGISGYPRRSLGWRQFRALGAAALDLSAVASATLDAYVDCSPNAHGVWDYAAGVLICTEAGAAVVDADDRDLFVLDHGARRTPIAAANAALLAQVLDARRKID